MQTFNYWSIFTLFYSSFLELLRSLLCLSDMLYLLKLWYFWFLFISTTIESYCRYTCFWSTLQILGYSSCVFCCNCYCLRAIQQTNYTVPSRNKVYIKSTVNVTQNVDLSKLSKCLRRQSELCGVLIFVNSDIEKKYCTV